MCDNIRERFKVNLKNYRLAGKQSGLKYCKSAKTFAEFINVNYNTYIDYERKGNSPSLDILVRIATALCVSIDDLLDYAPCEIDVAIFLSDLKIEFESTMPDNDNDESEDVAYNLISPFKLRANSYLLQSAIDDFKKLNTENCLLNEKQAIFYRLVNDHQTVTYNHTTDNAKQMIDEIDKITIYETAINEHNKRINTGIVDLFHLISNSKRIGNKDVNIQNKLQNIKNSQSERDKTIDEIDKLSDDFINVWRGGK